MRCNQSIIGVLDNENIIAYNVKFENNFEVEIINLGGVITKIITPDKDNNFENIVLGYENINDYIENQYYYGAIIGRTSGRICEGHIKIEDKEYKLNKNYGLHQGHGGNFGFNHKIWDVQVKEKSDCVSLILSRKSPHLEENYPGNLDVEVTFNIYENYKIEEVYKCKSDKTTIVNMTNHSYFNLNGEGSGTAMDQYLTIHAKYYTPVADSHSIPTGVYEEVAGTPMDFRTAKQIGQDIEAESDQLKFTGGYDHNYVTDNYAKGNRRLIATAYSDKTGIAMDVTSDCPCVQFYAANFVENEHGKNGHTYNKRDAFCLETQVEPNAVNVEDFHSPILNAGEQYDSVTAYHFYIRK